MDVTPQELRGSEIKEAWRGYHRDEVDELLERAAVTIEKLSQQLATAGTRPAPSESAPQVSRDDAEMLQRTLLLAQRAADDAVNEAQAQAKKLIEESEARAQTLVGEAETTARRIAESERRRLEAEIQDLASRREQLESDADALEAYATAYRERVRAAIEADLDRLSNGAIEAPTPRPALSMVEVPTPTGAFAPEAATSFAIPSSSGSDAEPEPERGGAASGDASSDTRAITIDLPGAEASAAAPVSSPRASEAAWPPVATEPETATADTAARASSGATASTSGSWLTANDDWSPADSSFDEPAPWDQATAAHEPFASDVPIEAKAIEGDALDDDAFFASLRDAVRDEQPLGPREDDDAGSFFDDELADDRRRFRRRR